MTAERTKFFARASIGGATECWTWQGTRSGTGYGYITMRRDGRKRNLLAHRVCKEMAMAQTIPRELSVHHVCENRLCVNPRHLEVVTEQEHHDRHRRTHCREGHELIEENTVVSKAGRICRICFNAYQRELKRRKRDERK